MNSLNKRWLYFIIVVGLIPILLRVFLWLFFIKHFQEKLMIVLSPNDFAGFGLALNIANIIEIMDKRDTIRNVDEKMGISIVFITVFILFFAISTIYELLEEGDTYRKGSLIGILVIATFPSIYYSHSVFKVSNQSTRQTP